MVITGEIDSKGNLVGASFPMLGMLFGFSLVLVLMQRHSKSAFLQIAIKFEFE